MEESPPRDPRSHRHPSPESNQLACVPEGCKGSRRDCLDQFVTRPPPLGANRGFPGLDGAVDTAGRRRSGDVFASRRRGGPAHSPEAERECGTRRPLRPRAQATNHPHSARRTKAAPRAMRRGPLPAPVQSISTRPASGVAIAFFSTGSGWMSDSGRPL